MARLSKRTDPRVAAFVRGVTEGRVLACRYVHLAVQRHLRDLERSESDSSYPYVFDYAAGQIILEFCKVARHWKGEWAGQTFEPRPDQAFMLWCLWGWKRRADGRRRFREALYEVGKKNGKTFLSAIVALALLVLDDEAGAEVYSTATKRDQAKLAWKDAHKIVGASPQLRRRITLPRGEHTYQMFVESTGSLYKALSSDDQGTDGVMPSGVINDELHRQVDRGLYDILKYGSRSRRQPLFFHGTTAGDELDTSLYADIHEYAIEVLEGVVEGPAADEFFALIFTLDVGEDGKGGDDWKDRRVWIKSNPGLGVNLREEDLDKDFQEALAKPAAEAAFKRLRLNVRTSTSNPWIRAEDWDACYDRELVGWGGWDGRQAYGGLDLASITDLCAFSTLFDFEDRLALRSVAWCPEDFLQARADRDRAGYVEWAGKRWLIPTPGNRADYRWIESLLVEWSKRYAYRQILYDPAKAADVVVRMADAGVPLLEGTQLGPLGMTRVIKRFEDYVLTKKIRHDGNPLLKWCITNVKILEIPSATGVLYKIRPANYRARIDAAVASLYALRLQMDLNPTEGGSGYDTYYDDEGEPGAGEQVPPPPAATGASGYDTYFEDETP